MGDFFHYCAGPWKRDRTIFCLADVLSDLAYCVGVYALEFTILEVIRTTRTLSYTGGDNVNDGGINANKSFSFDRSCQY